MKYYIRNNKGQYVGAISLTKILLMGFTVMVIIAGITYSMLYAPSANAKECPKRLDGVYDCTDTETKIKVYDLTLGGKQSLKWYSKVRTQKMTVTMYTSRVQETDSTPEIGATGENIWHLYQKGINTCASNDLPFGTKVTVPNLGTCIIKDRMNRRYTGKGHLDWYLGYATNDALKYGKRNVQVMIESK